MSRLQTATEAFRGASFLSYFRLSALPTKDHKPTIVQVFVGIRNRYLRANLLKLIQEPSCLD